MFKKDSNVQTFNSAEFGELRTQVAENGKIFFCLADVAKALDLDNTSRLKDRLNTPGVTSSKVGVQTGTKSDGTPAEQVVQMTFIDEPNLYRCIFQSRKKEAEAFQSWVFEEVLPSIRKTGGYIATSEQDTPEMIMAKALQVAAETIQRHEQKLLAKDEDIAAQREQIEILTPKAEYAEKVLRAETTVNVNAIAAELGVTAQCLNAALASMGIQYKQGKQWLLSAPFRKYNYTTTRTFMYNDTSGTVNTVWTQKGRAFVISLTRLARKGLGHKEAIREAISRVESLYEKIAADTVAPPDLL